MGKYIPINSVSIRKSNLDLDTKSCSYDIFPLYKSYQENYNYQNLKDSINNWNKYSENIGECTNKVFELFDIISEKGTKEQLKETTNIINSKIISYLKSPAFIKKDIQKRLNESIDNDYVKDCLESLMEQVNQEINCDRLLSNYNSIMKRFNIDKLIYNGLLYEENLPDTIYTLCELIDTYDMDIKSKICVTTEMALYTIDKKICEDIHEDLITENVIDYYMVNYGKYDIDKYLDEAKDALIKDDFINESSLKYIDYLQDVRKRMILEDYEKELNPKILDSSNYGFNEECNNIELIQSKIDLLSELALIDKAKEIITKIKMLPSITANSIKEAIRSLIVPFRVQDMKKGTANALSLVFYATVTVGALSIGVIPGILGLVSSLFLAKDSQRKYVKDALQEWKEHKYAINKKLKDTSDPEKRRKIEAYLDEVDKNIDILENEYEKNRDKSAYELNNDVDKKVNSFSYNPSSNLVSPDGKLNDSLVGSNTKKEIQKSSNNSDTKNNSSNYSSSINDDLDEYDKYIQERRKGGK